MWYNPRQQLTENFTFINFLYSDISLSTKNIININLLLINC